AFALDVGDTEGDQVFLVGNLTLHVVEHLAFDEDHRVGIADRGLEQALGVGRSGRHDHLETGDVRVPALECLRVLCSQLQRCATGSSEDNRAADLSTAHVSNLGGCVHHLIDGQQREVPGHHLDYRAQSHHGRTDTDAGESQFGDRSVDHATSTELLQQAARHLVGAIILGNFLTHEVYVVVPLHLFAERLVERIAVGHDGHQLSPSGA